jgi:hypothetical protein
MAEFLGELYLPRTEAAGPAFRADQARRAAEQLSREGTPVRYVRSVFVPEDETCFYLYEAGSVEAVGEAARRAGLSFDRIAAAMTSRLHPQSADGGADR